MKYILLLVFSLHFTPAIAQTVAVQLDKQNVVYIGIENPMTITAEGYKCKDLVVTTDNGIVTAADQAGHFHIEPLHTGVANITIGVRTPQGIKVLDKQIMRIKCIPGPSFFLLGKKNGFLSASLAHASIAPQAVLPNFDYDMKFVITGFRLTVTRNKNMLMTETVYHDSGARFTDNATVSAMMKSLKPGDEIFLDKFTWLSPWGKNGGDCSNMEPNTIDLIIN